MSCAIRLIFTVSNKYTYFQPTEFEYILTMDLICSVLLKLLLITTNKIKNYKIQVWLFLH